MHHHVYIRLGLHRRLIIRARRQASQPPKSPQASVDLHPADNHAPPACGAPVLYVIEGVPSRCIRDKIATNIY